MTNVRGTIHNIFVWSYERGTLQYDIICALILAFIFFVPPSCFVAKRAGNLSPSYQNTTVPGQNAKAAEAR
ncbi:MAG: hypothetical protein H6Q07_687 [Acidobacteria bacterium]|jgi:hypothetical protein|nr:hypothetical protein [Acidobacteriota bacterium]